MQIVTSPKHTDFDGLASIIAATLLYPDSTGVVPKEVSHNVNRFLSTHKTAFPLILAHEVEPEQVTRLIVVDTDIRQKLDHIEELLGRHDLDIHIWDHHINNGDIPASWRCQGGTGATVTLLAKELKKREIILSPLVSTVMLIGLYENTGHLTYPVTTVDDINAAAYLLENGADLNVAGFFLSQPYEEKQKEIFLELLKNTEEHTINDQTVGFNILRLPEPVSSPSLLVSMYRQTVHFDALFVIFVSQGRITVIGKSSAELINAGEVLRRLGGCGHAGAGSAEFLETQHRPEDIKKQLIEIVQSMQKGQVPITDLMSFPVEHVPPETSMRDVYDLMTRKKIRGVLVMDGDRLLGIVVLWDFKKIKLDRNWEKPVTTYMVPDPITVGPEANPAKVARLMIDKNIGHLPVVHEGKVIGIVTRTDILNYLYNLLPE